MKYQNCRSFQGVIHSQYVFSNFEVTNLVLTTKLNKSLKRASQSKVLFCKLYWICHSKHLKNFNSLAISSLSVGFEQKTV